MNFTRLYIHFTLWIIFLVPTPFQFLLNRPYQLTLYRFLIFHHLFYPLNKKSQNLFTTTVKPVLSNHTKQDIFLAFQTGGCLLLHESSAESSQTCVKRPYKTRHFLAFQKGGCLLLHEGSAESSFMHELSALL